jgi:hypothetical protein
VGDYPGVLDSSKFSFSVIDDRNEYFRGPSDWELMSWFDDDLGESLPSDYYTLSNYPNPFNAQTTISFEIPKTEEINLVVYNTLGQKVSTLADGIYPQGKYDITFDASNYSSGIYFYKLTTGEKQITKRMTLAK